MYPSTLRSALLCVALHLLPPLCDAITTVSVFQNYTGGYHTYRIPGLLRTSTTRTVALAEGRARVGFNPPTGNTSVCFGSAASRYDSHCTNKDIVYKTSDDFGATWSGVKVVPGATANNTHFFSNPQGLVEPPSHQYSYGRVFLMYSRCVVATAYQDCTHVIAVSTDDTDTWQGVQELSCSLTISGVSGGIITPSGRYIFPDQGVGAIYSDAAGAAGSWLCGSPSTRKGENMIAVLADQQTLIMTVRGPVNERSFALSTNGGATWGPAVVNPNLWEPDCQGAMIAVNYGYPKSYFLMFSNPHTNLTTLPPDPWGRANVTVQTSRDNGTSWQPLFQVTNGPSAYTSLYQLGPSGPNSCGILWEQSVDWPIDFLSIQLTMFDCLTGA